MIASTFSFLLFLKASPSFLVLIILLHTAALAWWWFCIYLDFQFAQHSLVISHSAYLFPLIPCCIHSGSNNFSDHQLPLVVTSRYLNLSTWSSLAFPLSTIVTSRLSMLLNINSVFIHDSTCYKLCFTITCKQFCVIIEIMIWFINMNVFIS